MPAVYEKLGIRFLYPENWTLDEQEALEGETTVALYSPSGGFWSIMLYEKTVDPAELALTALRGRVAGSRCDARMGPLLPVGDAPDQGFRVCHATSACPGGPNNGITASVRPMLWPLP